MTVSLGSLLTAAVAATGPTITLDTRLLPEIVVPVGTAGAGGGSVNGLAGAVSDLVLTLIQPAVTVTVGGQVVYKTAPYGTPAASWWVVVLLLGTLWTAFVAFLTWFWLAHR